MHRSGIIKQNSPLFAPGDLVFMFRRRKKGLGVVIDYVHNIEECIGGDAIEVLESYRNYEIKEWRHRDAYRQRVCRESTNPDLVFDFFVYNTAFQDTLKVSFAEVQWFKAPSTFNVDGVSAARGWFPCRWLKKY